MTIPLKYLTMDELIDLRNSLTNPYPLKRGENVVMIPRELYNKLMMEFLRLITSSWTKDEVVIAMADALHRTAKDRGEG